MLTLRHKALPQPLLFPEQIRPIRLPCLLIIPQAGGQFVLKSVARCISSEDLQVRMNLCAARGGEIIPEDERIGSIRKLLHVAQVFQAGAKTIKEQRMCESPKGHVMLLAHNGNSAVFVIGH